MATEAHLEDQATLRVRLQVDGDRSGEVAARRASPDPDAGGIEPDLGSMIEGPLRRGETVVVAGGKGVLRGEAIVDRQDPAA